MINERNTSSSSACLGFDGKLLCYHDLHKYDALWCALAWTNTGLNVLLAIIAVFYNTKILVDFSKCRRRLKNSNMLLFNLAMADVFVGLVILPSRALLLGSFLLKKTSTCQNALQILFKSLQRTLSMASLHAVLMTTIERYISIEYCMKYTVIITRTRMVAVISSAWFLSSILGLLILFKPQIAQLVLAVHVICICFTLGAINLKMHMVAKSQSRKIYLQRLSVRGTCPVKKHLKTHKSVAMVITAMTLCYFPYAVISLISIIRNTASLDSLQLYSSTSFLAASSLNSFVYFKQVKKSPFYLKRAMYVSTKGGNDGGCTI